jgi:hypothetical protein
MAHSTHTLCIKGVPLEHANAVVAAVVRKSCPTHGIIHIPDKMHGHINERLVFANLANGEV